jgi:DNA-binding response OmpR family regulator
MTDPSPPSRPVSVVVIDDVQDAADSLALYLRTINGFEVRTALDGEQGLKLTIADPPDAVVCDIGVPRMDGIQVARQLADILSPRPLLIAVTGFEGIFTREQALQVFDHYLVKPADPSEVASLIEAHVRHRPGERRLG